MNSLLVWLVLAAAGAPQGALPPEVDAKNRAVARLEERFAALPPYAAEYQAIIIRPDGKEEPGSEFLFWSDYLGMSLYTRVKIVDPENGNSTMYSILEKDQAWIWREEQKEAWWADLSDYFMAIRSAVDLTHRDLDRILPRTSEDPDPALCRGLQIVLDVQRKKDAKDEEGGIFQYSLRIVAPPASWLAEARATRDARMREDESGLVLTLPEDRKTLQVDKANGCLLWMESKDYDGATRRIVRRSFRPNCDPPAFQRPKGAALKPLPLGALKGYVFAYRQAIDLAASRLLWNWGRLGDQAPKIPGLLSSWSARYLDLWGMVFVDGAADAYVKERLDGGERLEVLERDAETEARRMGERIVKDGEFSGVARKLLEDYLSHWESSLRSHEKIPGGEAFLKALRLGLSAEEVFPKVAKVTQGELRRAFRAAVKRAGKL
jgi:hypothetical protein